MTKLRTLYELPNSKLKKELIELIADGDAIVERIISTGQTSPEDFYYDQEKDELVFLIDGEATLHFEETGDLTMHKGDYILIKAHERHKVTYTSSEPPCIWLAIHGNFNLMM